MKYIWSIVLPVFLTALPQNGRVEKGKAEIFHENGNCLINQHSEKAIVDWESFSVGLQEKVSFISSSDNSAILNRVSGSDISKIDGAIFGDGHVYLINPNGVLIGQSGHIETKGFTASSLDVLNEEFLTQKDMHFEGEGKEGIVHLGTIKAKKIYLLGKDVRSEGECKGDVVCFAAGEKILLSDREDKGIYISPKGDGTIDHRGRVEAIESQMVAAGGDLYTLALNMEGIIEAKGIEEKNGRVILSSNNGITTVDGNIQASNYCTGGYIEITGDAVLLKEKTHIDASGKYRGGEVYIGGGYQGSDPQIRNAKAIVMDKDARIYADALERGNGGRVVFWGDEKNHFYGKISAKGGELCGNGGFVEVSSKQDLQFRGTVDTSAKTGQTGTLLLDPSDITIGSFGGNSTPTFPGSPPFTYDPAVTSATVDVTDITSALATNNVTISTSAGTGGSGIVTFDVGFTWSANTTFTVLADREIRLNAVTISNTATLLGNFTAIDFRANQGTPIAANFDGINAFNSSFSSIEGNISFLARGGTTGFNSGIVLDNCSFSSTGTGADAATITLDGTGGAGTINTIGVLMQNSTSISSVSGAISITGSSVGTGPFNQGILAQNSVVITSTGTGGSAAPIMLSGTGGDGDDENQGIVLQDLFLLQTADGNINITANGNGTGINNNGMIMNSATIESTGSSVDAGTITMNITSGLGVNDNHALFMEFSNITSINGDINITATSQGSGDFNNGITLRDISRINSTGVGVDAADITLTTQGGGGTDDVFGVHGDFTSNVDTVDGDLTATGGFLLDSF